MSDKAQTQSSEVFDSVRTEVRQGEAKHQVAGIDDVVCKKCGNADSVFTGDKVKKCSQCGGTEWHTVMRFEADEVNSVLGRQLVFIALDGKEFDNRLYCEAYNSYLMGNTVEADKCPQCGALYLVKDENRKRCDVCGLSAEYFRRGTMKKKYIETGGLGVIS